MSEAQEILEMSSMDNYITFQGGGGGGGGEFQFIFTLVRKLLVTDLLGYS